MAQLWVSVVGSEPMAIWPVNRKAKKQSGKLVLASGTPNDVKMNHKSKNVAGKGWGK